MVDKSVDWPYTYEELLERAYKNMPQKVITSERFEIPKIIREISGNKTIVVNFGKIANYLNRDINHMLKFFSKELATYSNLDGGKAIFIGKFSIDALQKKLQKYIKIYVICPQCGKPDTIIMKKGRIYLLKCLACGAITPIPKV